MLEPLAPTTRPPCAHCGLPKVNRPRGLCWTCYHTPGVRGLYRSDSIYQRRGVRDFYGRAPAPEAPTDAPPGSEAKLLVMMARAAAGRQLFHPHDRTAR